MWRQVAGAANAWLGHKLPHELHAGWLPTCHSGQQASCPPQPTYLLRSSARATNPVARYRPTSIPKDTTAVQQAPPT